MCKGESVVEKRVLSLVLTLVMVMTFLPVTKAEAAGSATGQQIVDCAMQYLGKVPYVWGGEKIDGANPGADCSGFICRIYEKFGFNFWANRTKLRNCGTNLGTNLNVAQLGDIIWYDGHVAIYAGKSNGNHMIIHETGGKYQNVVYTKASIVSAELKGVIRIPGIRNDGSGYSSTQFYGKVKNVDGYLAINDAPKASPKYSNEIGRIPEGATCVVYTNKASGNWWWVEYGGVKGWAYGSYITLTGAVPVNTKYYLDLNGYVNGSNVNNTSGYGTADVYINGTLVANDCTDYYTQWPSGTKYEIKDIQAASGYRYDGLRTGSISGTIGGNVDVRLSFSKVQVKNIPVKFYLNSEGNNSTVTYVKEGQTLGTLPPPAAKDGYTFAGYYTAWSGGTRVTSSTVVSGVDALTLYPQYTKNAVEQPASATVYYYADGQIVMTQSTTVGSKYYTTPYERKGYTFLGWFNEGAGGTNYSGGTITASSPRILYAQYAAEAPQQYTVYLYMNGYVYKTLTVTNGSTYGTLPSPKMDGYEFLGWYTSSSGGTKVTSSTKVNLTGSQTLYARFEEIPEEGGNIILQINNPTMYINGRPSSIDAQGTVPVIRNDRTLLPVRAVFEAMGGTVGWDNDTRIVTLNLDGKILYLQIGTAGAIDGDLNKYYLDTAPVIINNRTMLPIRFIVEFFDGTVEWDGDTRTVLIRY